jgi:hypothetical protein
MVHFNLGDMGTNNTVVWSMSGGTLTHNYLMRNGRDDQGTTFGYATATFEVIGAAPNINFGSYKSAQRSTLRGVIDANGLATIKVAGTATFGAGSMIDMALAPGYTLPADTNFPLLEADTIINQGLSKPIPGYQSNTICCWDFQIKDIGGKDVLLVTYRANCDETDCAYCVEPLLADLNGDCQVDLEDFALFAVDWLKCNWSEQSACFN